MHPVSTYVPFTYYIKWSKLGVSYYGARYKRGCNPSDLWTTYFSSSKYVHEFRKLHGEPDIIKITRTFQTKRAALEWERRLLRRIDAKKNPRMLNKSNGAKEFGICENWSQESRIKASLSAKRRWETNPISPETRKRMSEAATKRVSTEGAREKIANSVRGHKQSKETLEKKSKAIAGLKWFTNGTTSIRTRGVPPDGFYPGRMKWK